MYRFGCVGPREQYRRRYLGILLEVGGEVEQIHVPHLAADVMLPRDADLRARALELLEAKWADIAHNTIMTAGKNDLLDKYLAGTLLFRIPELTLHTLSAIGGSPAAFVAMAVFRHKTIKSSFRILFWSIVVLQLVLTAYVVKVLWWN